MPQALGLLLFGSASSLSIGGIALTTAAGGLTFAGTVFNLGATLLLSAASQALFAPDLPSIGPDSIKVNTASEMMPRVKHFGEVRVGYAITFTGAKSGKLYRLIVHGHGQIDGVETYYLDKGVVTIDGNGFVQEDLYQNNLVKIETRLGVIPEIAYQDLIDDFPEWTAEHRLDGLSSTLLVAQVPELERFNAVFPNREPSLEVVLRGSLVTDPRTKITGYTDNLALCAYAYETDPDGGNIASSVDLKSFVEAADACDELITIVGSAPERKWRFAGSYDLNEDPAAVRARFLGACGGEYYITPEGRLGLRVGGWEEPRFTLTPDMLTAEGYEAEFGLDAVSGYSISAFQYVEPSHRYVRINGDQYEDAERIEAIGRQKNNPFISAPSHRQCRHAAKIMMEQENPDIVLRLTCKPAALEMFYERFVGVKLQGLSGIFQIKSKAINPENLTQTYSLALVRREKVELPPEEFGNVPEYAGATTSTTTPIPTGLTAVGAGSTGNAGIAIGFDPAPQDGLTPFIELGTPFTEVVDNDPNITGTNWSQISIGSETQTVEVMGLRAGKRYFVRMAWRAASGALGEKTDDFSVNATESKQTPAQPTSFTVATVFGSNTAELNFVVAASDGVHLTQVLRDGDLIARLSDNRDQAVQFFDTPLDEFGNPKPGTYEYSLVTVGVSYERAAPLIGNPIVLQ